MRAKITRELLRGISPKSEAFDVNDTEVKGFLARVNPGGAITYGIRYTGEDGKQARYSLRKNYPATSPSDAREKARIELGKIASGNSPAAEKKAKQKGKLTLLNFIDGDFGDHVRAHNKSAQSTIDMLKTVFPDFAGKSLSEIDGRLVDKWRAARIKSGVMPATVNRNMAALGSMFSRAVEWKLIADHPLKTIKRMKETGDPIVRYLSHPEETRLRAALDQREVRVRDERTSANEWRLARHYDLLPELDNADYVDYLQPAILLSLNTGVRQGELLSLRWSSIDLKKGLLTVRAATAKGERTRHVPLNSEAKSTLLRWKSNKPDTAYVFAATDGERMTEIKTAWRNLLVDAKIEDFRWHDMRHSFASHLVMAGVDLNSVRELLGHSDLKMTLRYAHLAPAFLDSAVEKLIKKVETVGNVRRHSGASNGRNRKISARG